MTEREEKPKEGFFQKVKHLFKHDKKDERDYMDENTIGGQNKDAEVSRPIPIGVTYPNPSNQSNIKEENHLNQPKTTGEIGSEQYVHHIGKSKEPQDSSLIKEDQKDSNFLKEHQNKDLKPKEVITTVKKEKKFDEPRQYEGEGFKEGEHQMKQPKQKKEKEVIRLLPTGENESNLERDRQREYRVDEPNQQSNIDPMRNIKKDRSLEERDRQRDYQEEPLKQKPKEVITTVEKVSKFVEGNENRVEEQNQKQIEPKRNVEMNRNVEPNNQFIEPIKIPKEVIKTTKTVTTTESRKDENQLSFKPVLKEVTKTIEKEIIYEKKRDDQHPREEIIEPQPKLKEIDLVFEKQSDKNLHGQTNNLQNPHLMEGKHENVNMLPGQHQNVSSFQEPRNENVNMLPGQHQNVSTFQEPRNENVNLLPGQHQNISTFQEPRNENVNFLPGKKLQHQNVSSFQELRNQNVQPLTNTGLVNSPSVDAKFDEIGGNKRDNNNNLVNVVEKQIGNDKDIHIYLNDKKNDSQGLNTGNF